MTWNLKNNWTFLKWEIAVVILSTMTSCTAIKPYQRAYLEDRDMAFKQNAPEKFEQSAHTYREGAAGGGMGKSSGGCGCN
jgi:uncharacterized membrane protein